MSQQDDTKIDEDGIIKFNYAQLTTMMIKAAGLTSGFWAPRLEFGLGAMNVGRTFEEVLPTAIVPVVSIGLQPAAEGIPMAIDASVVNAPTKAVKIPAKSGPKRTAKNKTS